MFSFFRDCGSGNPGSMRQKRREGRARLTVGSGRKRMAVEDEASRKTFLDFFGLTQKQFQEIRQSARVRPGATIRRQTAR